MMIQSEQDKSERRDVNEDEEGYEMNNHIDTKSNLLLHENVDASTTKFDKNHNNDNYINKNSSIENGDCNNPVQELPVVVQQQQQQQQQQGNLLVSWNVFCCFMAWAFTVSVGTSVIGLSSVVALAISNNNVSITSFPVGAFIIGNGLVSGLSISSILFFYFGNQYSIIIGCIVFGLIGGVLLSIVSIYYSIISLYILSNVFSGMSIGLNYYLRFIVTELVPIKYKAHAVTITVSGGIIAAFVGPELSHLVTSSTSTSVLFSNDTIQNQPHYKYIELYCIIGLFYILTIIFVFGIRFPQQIITTSLVNSKKQTQTHNTADDISSSPPPVPIVLKNIPRIIVSNIISRVQLWISLLQYTEFLLPMLVATFSWTVMALPMSVVRVAMKDINVYTIYQSLRVIELHFVGMYSPGFINGYIITYLGYPYTCLLGIGISLVSTIISLLIRQPIVDATTDDDTKSYSIVLWVISMMLCGVGWNFAFTASTVWITQLYNTNNDETKSTIGSTSSANHTNDENLLDKTTPLSNNSSNNNNNNNKDIESCHNEIINDEDQQTNENIKKKNIHMYTKEQIQSTNEFFMFLISGVFIVSASYIYKAGGSKINGWRILNYVTLAFTILYMILVCHYIYFNKKK